MHISLPALFSLQVAFGEAIEAYDYVILGGGTAGLVVANRLSQDPTISVAVVEAGNSVRNNPNVTQIENFFVNLGTSIDWQYQSQPQKYTDNRVLTYHSGKALGGTSTINGATYIRAQKAQIDAWQQLGNHGWNWSSFLPYYKKSESFQPLTPELIAKGAEYEPAVHGHNGNVHVGWSNYMQNGSTPAVLSQTFQNLGIPYKKDQSDGNLHGFSVWPSTIISEANIRADSARNYLYPIQNRPNLRLFTNTLAEKIIWHDNNKRPSNNAGASASGVQVNCLSTKQSRIISVKREVIISAGTLQSPIILESSGIGNPRVLSSNSIPVVVNLPSVGSNLQDQPLSSIVASSTWKNRKGYTPYVTFATASDLFGKNTSSVAAHVRGKIPEYASAIASEANDGVSRKVVETQLRIQADLIFNKGTPCAEIISVPTGESMMAVFWPLLPFSRGSVHLDKNSADDITGSMPGIDPNFFMLDWDAISMAATAELVRKSFGTEPLKSFVGEFVTPDLDAVPIGAGVDGWMEYFKSSYAPNYHPVGTCAMMSRELGGVVDPQLRVYGTSNVRVVDASVLPFQIDGHLTSTIYAVAERAADIIKGVVG